METHPQTEGVALRMQRQARGRSHRSVRHAAVSSFAGWTRFEDSLPIGRLPEDRLQVGAHDIKHRVVAELPVPAGTQGGRFLLLIEAVGRSRGFEEVVAGGVTDFRFQAVTRAETIVEARTQAGGRSPRARLFPSRQNRPRPAGEPGEAPRP